MDEDIATLRELIGDDIKLADLWDRAVQRGPGGDYTSEAARSSLDNIQEASSMGAPSGTSANAALRRLRKDRPDLHARVLEGELSPHAAAVEAGFRKRTYTIPHDDKPLSLSPLPPNRSQSRPRDTYTLFKRLCSKRERFLSKWLDTCGSICYCVARHIEGAYRMKAILYTRVSTLEQATQGVSLDAQEARLRAYCTLAGLDLVEIVREEGVSGGKPLADRPGGKRLLEALASGEASHVVALKLDRLFRDAVDAMGVSKDWDAAGVALHLVDMGGQTINTATAMGRFFLTMMAGFAELERNLISERTAAALRHKQAQGEHVGSPALGFEMVDGSLQENSSEAATVARIKELRAEGHTLRAIAATLTEEGHTTKRGGKWHSSTVSYVVKRLEANG